MLKNITTIVAFLALIFVVGFGAWYYTDIQSKDTIVETESETESEIFELITETTETKTAESETTLLTENISAENDFSFSDISNMIFQYADGTQYVQLMIYSDGSFIGEYGDVRAYESSLLYSNGSVLYNEFVGQFSEPVINDDGVYEFSVIDFDLKYTDGTSEVKDDVLYEYSALYYIDLMDVFNIQISDNNDNAGYILYDMNTNMMLQPE